MSGKKKGTDIFSDFFGDDDVDWLDEDAEEESTGLPRENTGSVLKGTPAPPRLPPTPAGAPQRRKPRDPKADPVPKLDDVDPIPTAPAPARVHVDDSREEMVVAPSEPLAAALIGVAPGDLDAGETRASVDDTVGSFLESLPGESAKADDADEDAMSTLTDHEPASPLDEIVVEEDSADEIAAVEESVTPDDAATSEEGATSEDVATSEEASAESEAASDEEAASSEEAATSEEGATSEDEGAPEAVEASEADDAASEEAATSEEHDVASEEAATSEDDQGASEEAEASSEESAAAADDESADADDDEAEPAVAREPAAPLRSWSPQSDEDTWRELVAALEAGAAEAEGAAGAALLVEAARVRRDRLADVDGAKELLGRAAADLADLESYHDAVAETATRSGDVAEVADAVSARAALLDGPLAAESWQAAAMIQRHRLQDLEQSEALLRKAIEADSEDYASLSLLRDQLTVKGREDDRAAVLRQICELVDGRVAAEAWWELGRLLHKLGREDEAGEAYANGREADPSHAPCFLALQAVYVAAADDLALGELYLSEAARSEGPDKAEWLVEAARAFVDARAADRADAAFAEAVEAGHPLARREQQAWFLATDRLEAYAEATAAEAEATAPEAGQAFVQFRLGRALEDQGDYDGALAAYRKAVELDASAGPAAEAVARVLLAAGQHEPLMDFWQARVDGTEDPDLKAAVLLRMSEIAQAGLGDDARARALLEQIVEVQPTNRAALDALRRAFQRTAAWPELAGVYETLAGLEESPELQAQQFAKAGNVWRYRAGDTEKARAAYGRALELVPAHAIAADEQVDLLEELGDWKAQALVLRAASDAVQNEADKLRYAYRSGQVWLDRLQDAERAVEAFRICLEIRPGFLPALSMLKQIAARAGHRDQVYQLYIQQAEGLKDDDARHWRLLAAADLAGAIAGGDPGGDLSTILEKDPAHVGATTGQELRLLTMGAKVGLLNLYRRTLEGLDAGPRRSALLVRVAGLFEALGDASGVREPLAEAVTAEVEGTPNRALARLAEGQRHWAEAVDALSRAGSAKDRLELSRLQALRLDQVDEALAGYAALLDDPDAAVGAALGAAVLAQRVGDGEILLQAHRVLAEKGGPYPVRAAHALWSGQLAEAAEKPDEALEMYRKALELRPTSLTAFDGARRQLLAAEDAAGLDQLWRTYRPADRHGLVLDLERVGDDAGAVTVWQEAVDSDGGVAAIAQLEVAKARVGDWRGVYDAATRRAALVSDPEVKATADAKRRWLLAEKLADTDEAWELYKALHEENPEDREVTSALAQIAFARGETRMAITYLEALADGADDPQDAAALRVRIGDVHEGAGSTAEARQAWLDALDHQSDNAAALGGLKRLATAEEDWPGLLDVLRREASLVEGAERVTALREIAQVTQDRLEDPAQAMDAWRAVSELEPDDVEALEALLALAESTEDWEAFLQAGDSLAGLREGKARTELLRRMGNAATDELGRDDAYRFWERAIEGEADLEAAQRLEAFYRGRGDSTNTVRLLALQADLVDEPAERTRLLGDAATIEAEVRNDRAYAARLFQKALDATPDDPRALRFLAEYLFEQDRIEDALPIFERLAPNVEDGQDLDDFDVQLELTAFHFHFASMLTEVDRGDEAVAPAEKALSHTPNHQPTLHLVAPLYMARGEWKKANAIYRKLLQLTGGEGDKEQIATMYANLGVVERALGRNEKASKRFSKALDLVPNHIGALQGMATVLEDEENWSALLNVYNNIIYHAPEPADVTAAYLTKGRILDEQMGRADKAAQHYERSLAYDANQPGALLRLAELALRRSDWAEAVGLAQRGIKLVGKQGPLRADLLLAMAIARHGQDDARKSKRAITDARKANPELELGEDPLADTDALREGIRARLPR